jgi:hypothetical protein
MHPMSAKRPEDARREDLASSWSVEDVGPGVAGKEACGCVIQTNKVLMLVAISAPVPASSSMG